MKRLFIELYLDEDVDVLVAQLLKARGFTTLTTSEAKQKGMSDVQQLAYAVNQRMALMTHNRIDFEALVRQYYEKDKTHYGIIIAARRPPHELVRRLLMILNQVTADEMINQIRYI